jgi:hypothetical protein
MIREMLALAATSASQAEIKLETIFAHKSFSFATRHTASEISRNPRHSGAATAARADWGVKSASGFS